MIDNLVAWYGSEASYREVERLLDMAVRMPEAKLRFAMEDNSNPIGYEVLDGIAMISTSGSLVSSGNWMTKWLGIPSYDDIIARFHEAGEDKSVQQVIHFINSPGGAAEGCKGCASFIESFSQNVKPVVSYTDRQACSAGYWLFAAGDQAIVGEDARIGSIGALLVHTEYTEMDKQMGITRTVFRSAPLKAKLNPYEKLDEAGTEEAEKELKWLHDSFVGGVSLLRQKPVSTVEKKMATGAVFRSQEAISMGLADKVMNFDSLMAKLTSALKRKK